MQRILIILVLITFFAAPALADFEAGKDAYNHKDWTRAITELRPLVEAGDERAMIILGNMYSGGLGVIRSYKEAFSLYKRAATEKNNPQAMAFIGGMYFSGLGVPRHVNTALQWLQRSAMLGDQQGMFVAAAILFQGNKSTTDDVKPDAYNAYKWYKIASAKTQYPKIKKLSGNMAQLILKKNFLTAKDAAKADKEAAAFKPADSKDLGPFPAEPPATETAPPPESPDKSPPHSGPAPK
jgi:TPR repeat protein